MGTGAACPACGRDAWKPFYRVEEVPVQSCRQMPDRTTALAQPRGRLDLALCRECGFAANTAFRPELLDYAADYESTQAESATFQAYARRLAAEWIERYDLQLPPDHRNRLRRRASSSRIICAMGNKRAHRVRPGLCGGPRGRRRADRTAGVRTAGRAIRRGPSTTWPRVISSAAGHTHTLDTSAQVADFRSRCGTNLEGRANVSSPSKSRTWSAS